ncbi:ATP-dependent DNA helicase Pif1-like [Rhizophagus clarus]|uniref:ATP-dependent DNA helicase n=1 Tax=Rhizophagus clarus TaxID=94130 RepID=A0A8H3QH88_9GLOM|nr:ATP-dependent DNA helicase Pif1-like [Rhizophagus clarus]
MATTITATKWRPVGRILQYIGMINSEPVDLLGLPVDNKENEATDDECLKELSEDDESEEYRYDWMCLAEMEASDFIRNALNKDQKNNDRCDNRDLVDFQTLNVKQNSVLKQIELHYNNILMGKEVEALRMIIMGTAGTGKSYLIRVIREKLQTIARSGHNLPIIVLALIGVAAFNINEIDGEYLKQLQKRLQGVHYVIIDELSMISQRMLAKIDTRLRQGFPENRNVPFSGRFIILFSDFGQLPSVLDLPMYTTDTSRDASSNNSIVSYKSFSEACKLDVIER